MFTYSKLAQAGIAAVSYLAEIASEQRLAGSAEIAENREISRALTAKILTQLSAAGLVYGKTGPSGGYRLTRDPSAITLLDVVRVFEDETEKVMCPFGPHWCGVGIGPHCPLHDSFEEMRLDVLERLQKETFAQFEEHRKMPN